MEYLLRTALAFGAQITICEFACQDHIRYACDTVLMLLWSDVKVAILIENIKENEDVVGILVFEQRRDLLQFRVVK